MRFIFDNHVKVAENVFDEIIKSQVNSRKNTCVICFEDLDVEMGNVYTIPSCKHSFHEDCVRQWKREKATCPFCRGPLPEELGETRGSGPNMDIDNSIELIRRVLEIIQEMESDPVEQPWWKDGLLNIGLSPLGILLPPVFLLLLWTFEAVALVIGLVILPFLVLRRIRTEQNGRCSFNQLTVILVIILCYPFVIFVFVVIFVVLQVFYSLVVTAQFYLDILRCRRRWRDAYEDIVHGSIGFLEARIAAAL